MRQLEQDEPLAAANDANIVHPDILFSSQNVRVALLIIDMLMTLYNEQKKKKSNWA
jgi:hypothetical protein